MFLNPSNGERERYRYRRYEEGEEAGGNKLYSHYKENKLHKIF